MARERVGLIGTGLSASCFKLGSRGSNIEVVQPGSLGVQHYSSREAPGGLAKYWHRGLMSPGFDFIAKLGIDDEVAVSFNEAIGIKADFHHTCGFMTFPSAEKNSFILQKYEQCGSLKNVRRVDQRFILEFADQSWTFDRLILALGVVGNLQFLSKCEFIDKSIVEKTTFNDHFMSADNIVADGSISPIAAWEQDGNCISQLRPSISSKAPKIPEQVELLSKNYFHKVMYGMLAPALVMSKAADKVFRLRNRYRFNVITPAEPVFRFSTIECRPAGALAYHPIGSSTYEALSQVNGITLLSGNFLPLDYRFFPSYMIGLHSFWQGVRFGLR